MKGQTAVVVFLEGRDAVAAGSPSDLRAQEQVLVFTVSEAFFFKLSLNKCIGNNIKKGNRCTCQPISKPQMWRISLLREQNCSKMSETGVN